MARRAFRDHLEFFSEQCNISKELLQGFYYLYVAMASRLPLCPTKVERYCKDLKSLYIAEIPWHPMTPSMHKVIEHLPEILRLLPPTVSIGMLSEEPSESANKDIKHWQLNHSRQNDPELRNLDVIKRLCHCSDPLVLSEMSPKKKKNLNDLNYPAEILNLCKTSDDDQ